MNLYPNYNDSYFNNYSIWHSSDFSIIYYDVLTSEKKNGTFRCKKGYIKRVGMVRYVCGEGQRHKYLRND